MEQKFDGTPKSELRIEGRKVSRGPIVHDWGSLVQWVVKKDGKVIATAPARMDTSFEHPDTSPGKYEIVLQMWKYIDYKKNPAGEFINSKFVDISNTVTYQI